MIKSPRGTRDLLPPDTALWNFVEAAVRDVFRAYNFHEIRTPIFESTELFARGVGEETDIVAKEMFTWEDRGRAESDKGQSLTLRPENTAGVVRAYIEHKLWDRGLNKLFYIGPQFRRERPQKGRYRQFYQIGAEVIGPPPRAASRPPATPRSSNCWPPSSTGSASPHGRSNSTPSAAPPTAPVSTKPCAKPSSPSPRKCAPIASAASSPTRCASSTAKSPKTSPSSKSFRASASSSTKAAASISTRYRQILKSVGVPYVLNDRLVRGLDYYTRTAFEFTHGALGAQNAILGGGRYDGLIGSARRSGRARHWLRDRRRPARHVASTISRVRHPQAGCLHRSARRGHESRSRPPGPRTPTPRPGRRPRRRVLPPEKVF